MDIISKKHAREQGLKFYFTGKACSNGHTTERYVSSGSCKQCMSDRSEYAKQYYEDNKDRCQRMRQEWYQSNKTHVAEYTATYYAANKDALSQRHRQWRHNNKDQVADRMRRWREAHPDYHKIQTQQWLDHHPNYQREYYANNKDTILELAKRWRLNNPARAAAGRGRYRAAKLMATPGWAAKEQVQISALYELRDTLTMSTGIPHHVDHIIPLQHDLVCGLHCLANLQILPYGDNISKSNIFTI